MKTRTLLTLCVLGTCLIGQLASAQTSAEWEPKEGGGSAAVTAVGRSSANPEMAVVGYENGDVYLTLTDGTSATPSWLKVDDPAQGDSLPNKMITSIAVSPRDTKTYFIAFGGCKYYGNLWVTKNGGRTFNEVVTGPYCNLTNVSINPIDTSIIYVTDNGGNVHTSDDYGDTWTTGAIADPLTPPDAIGAISAVGAAQGSYDRVLVGTTAGEIWMTSNAQDADPSWILLTDDGYPYPDFPEETVSSLVWDDRYAPAMFYATFNKTMTGDSIWTNGRQGSPYGWAIIQNDDISQYAAVGSVSINPAVPGTLYATTTYTEYNPYKSDDNGANWFDGGANPCTCESGCANVETAASPDFGTTDAKCFAIDADINGWNSWEYTGRDIIVNGEVVSNGGALPEQLDGTYYFYFTEGDVSWTGWTFW